MCIQFTSLRYYEVAQAKKQTHFYYYDLVISEVSHYGFLRDHSSIKKLKDPTVGFKKRIQINKMNSLI
jgi:hypothetical protein